MIPTISLSKEWTKEQKEVWKTVEDHWAVLIDGEVDEFLKYIHPDFVGFGHESPLFVDRGWLEHWVGHWTKNTEIPIHYMRPIHIILHGDIAIVQYVIFTIEKRASGVCRHIRRYTMTWKKGKGRWQVIGSHNNLMHE